MSNKIGDFFFERSNNDSPESFTRICTVTDMPEFGETNEQVENTTFCSGGKKTYIPGLSDGMDVAFTLNRDPSDAGQAALKADVRAKINQRYRWVEEVDGSPHNAFTCEITPLHWGIAPSQRDPNKFMFAGKVSGDLVESTI